MRRAGCSLLILVLCAAAVVAQRTVTSEKFGVADTPVGLSTTTTDPAGKPQIGACLGRLETGPIRMMDLRAVAVSATTGLLLEVGDLFDLVSHDFAVNARFVKTGSTTGVVTIECWQ